MININLLWKLLIQIISKNLCTQSTQKNKQCNKKIIYNPNCRAKFTVEMGGEAPPNNDAPAKSKAELRAERRAIQVPEFFLKELNDQKLIGNKISGKTKSRKNSKISSTR